MRNTSGPGRGRWATLVTRYREAAGLSKVEFARRLGVDRSTILRWEQGTTKPEEPGVVQRVAALFAIDLDDALAAAGLRPADERRPEPPPPLDPDVATLLRKLADPDTTEATKNYIRETLRLLANLPEEPRQTRRRKAG